MRLTEFGLVENAVLLFEKMVHIGFDDDLLLPYTFPHNVHYGNIGNIRFHIVIPTHH